MFKPAVYKSGVLHELPRPVRSLRILDAWDFAQFKVPLADGDFTAGHSRQGIDIAIEGELGTQAGVLTATEPQMFAAIEALRGALDLTASAEKFEFFLYHDPATATYRKFKSCVSVRFESDLSRHILFTYSLLIHAEDPVIYSTPPGT